MYPNNYPDGTFRSGKKVIFGRLDLIGSGNPKQASFRVMIDGELGYFDVAPDRCLLRVANEGEAMLAVLEL